MQKKNQIDNISSAKDILDRILSTLESRRDQLAARSAVCLAAASGLIALAIQFLCFVCDADDHGIHLVSVILLIICLISSALAISTSIDLIKKISRVKKLGKELGKTKVNIFFFGWISQRTELELEYLFEKMTIQQQLRYEARQAISLSKNLEYRYKQFGKTYIFFVVALAFYLLAVICFVYIKYFGSNTIPTKIS